MGSEIIVVLVPIGMAIILFLLYRIARGPDRPYPAVALTLTLAAAGYMTLGAPNHNLDWFFIWFTLLVVPIGAAAHAVKRRSLANE